MKIRAGAMVAVVIVSAAFSITAIGGEETDVKEFKGDFRMGFNFKCGDSFAMAPMFIDKTRAPVIKSADDKVSDKLLKEICVNGDDLKIAPALARSLDKQLAFQGNPYGEALHIAVFPHAGIKVSDELKAAARFKPGTTIRVAQVVEKYGKPQEREA